jgi:heparan-alpha-glucosaminide N-acetyltransferase
MVNATEMSVLPDTATPPPAALQRLASIDAFRGLVMLLMMAEVLRLARVSDSLPDSGFWKVLAHHQTHAAWHTGFGWNGCTLHDLIQPSFSFLVGVALPFSLARRAAVGQPAWRRTLHAFWRALVLVLLGVFLRSTGSTQTNWTFEDTLTQIGLGYGFLYLLSLGSRRVQWIGLAAILVGYWLAFAWYPVRDPGGPFSGFAAHWNLNANAAWAFDTWFMNLFPREHPFTANGGGYSTLSFIPTLGTMILGLLAGSVLRGERSPGGKVRWLLFAAGAGLAASWLLDVSGLCPIVKRIWTPSWVLFSGGWAFLFLAAFYLVMDVWQRRGWAFVLKVVGMNSIAAYLIAHLWDNFIARALPRHLGREAFTFAGKPYEPLVHGAAVLLVEWLILWWMYRRKIFLRI